jgi:hypothetical protein
VCSIFSSSNFPFSSQNKKEICSSGMGSVRIGAFMRNQKKKERKKKEASNQSQSSRGNQIFEKVHALIWIIFAAGLVHLSDIVTVLRYSPLLNQLVFSFLFSSLDSFLDSQNFRLWLEAGFILLLVSFFMISYLAIWLTRFRGYSIDAPEIVDSGLIPLTTFTGITSFVCLTVGLWPVYSILAIPLLGVIAFGAIMLLNFLPSF